MGLGQGCGPSHAVSLEAYIIYLEASSSQYTPGTQTLLSIDYKLNKSCLLIVAWNEVNVDLMTGHNFSTGTILNTFLYVIHWRPIDDIMVRKYQHSSYSQEA